MSYRFMPTLQIDEARNGIFRIKIINYNINTLYQQYCSHDGDNHDDYNINMTDPQLDALEIGCKFPNDPSFASTNTEDMHSIDGELFATELITIQNISDDGEIYIKFPVHFQPYNVKLYVQANSYKQYKRPSTNIDSIIYSYLGRPPPMFYSFGWHIWPKTNIYIKYIPSFLSYDEYKPNENIRIQYKNKLIDAKIIKILNDNTYQISYDLGHIRNKTAISISEIYPNAIPSNYMLNWEGIFNLNIYKTIFIERYNEEEFKDTICAIWDAFLWDNLCEGSLDLYYFVMGNRDWLGMDLTYYMYSVQNFLTKCISEFLFKKEYHYHVDCIRNTNDGELILKSTNTNCWCHCCGKHLNEWDFSFVCNGHFKHIICTECIYTMIEANNELKPLLHEILKEQLNIDCIQMIVDHCVGRINCRKYS